ncbi:MAG: hypothetical protein ACE5FG_11260, partial [Myxococcota bacterium]
QSAGIEVPGLLNALLNTSRGISLSAVGQFEEGHQALWRARELAARTGDEFVPQIVHCFLAQNEIGRGDLERALDYGRQAVDLAEKVGTAAGLMLAHLYCGQSLYLQGRFEEAQGVLGRGLDYGEQAGVRLFRPGILSMQAFTLVGLGRAGEAVALANEAVETSQMAVMRVQAHICRAHTLRLRDGLSSLPEIEADLATASALVEEHGLRSMTRPIHEERAQLAKHRGDESSFRTELGHARNVAAELGATGHLERLQRELASP